MFCCDRIHMSNQYFSFSLSFRRVHRSKSHSNTINPKARGPTKAADGYPITVSNDDKISDLKPTTKSIGTDKINKSYTLSYPDASYISIHFKEFDLPKSCFLQINNGEGKQAYVMRELGRHGLGKDFWARHVTGKNYTAFVSLFN